MTSHFARADGEPAEDFLKRLRAARYFDTAIAYLNRLDQYPGVDPELMSAVSLEKAQTFIDAAVASRSNQEREQFLDDAETSLSEFLQKANHPRASEAQIQLGKLQLFRGNQSLMGEVDAEKSEQARKHYLASVKTFDAIIENLKAKLAEMKGQKIDPDNEPEKASLRDTYRFEYLQAQVSAGETRVLAAKTFDDPPKQAKPILDEALKRFTEMADKYANYSQGAIATLYLGQIQELLGNKSKAIEHYKEMVETIDADPLRDAKFEAAAGLINIYMGESPSKFQAGIDVGKPLEKGIRPNEKTATSVQRLRVALAKAYLAKSVDKDNQKATDMKRAKSSGRTLLNEAAKIPGAHTEEVKQLLSGLGITQEEAKLPTAEQPKSLQDALDSARTILAATQNIEESLKLLDQEKETDELKAQKEALQDDLRNTYSIGVQILRAGLGMAHSRTDTGLLTQARHFLAYTLYRQKQYRDTVVVGSYLARNAPGTEAGLQGGLWALTSLQFLLIDVPKDENDGLLTQLEQLGDFLMETWPDNPDAAKAQGVRIQLLLQKDDYEGAKKLIAEMKKGPEQGTFQRLLGQLLYNRALKMRIDGKGDQAAPIVADAAQVLQTGLDSISGNLIPGEAMQAAVVLARVYQEQDNSSEAIKVLDHPRYGPMKLIKSQGPPNKNFTGDLYSIAIKVLFAEMIAADDPEALLKRSTGVMEELRAAYPGKTGQEKLSRIYRRMAQDLSNELKTAPPAKKDKLIKVFKVFLQRMVETTNDEATLNWAGQTLIVMGKEAMPPGAFKATGQAAELIQSAADIFKKQMGNDLSKRYQYASALRLLGQYKSALSELEAILKQNQMMLDAQIEAALAYEYWAGEQKNAGLSSRVYNAALSGGRPGANGKNVIWGWGLISKQTNGRKEFRDKFFQARYHVGLCRYLEGKKANKKATMSQAIKDITQIEALYPDMGGAEQRAKFDALLKEVQKAVGEKPTGLKPFKPAAAKAAA
ncbi:tetratricopeptide repeat protein [Stieleria marina]|uniref:tetratricopeptide repeat protein n=1 Tax=Stieleria marina TaxID=1930275 RepID=UPI003AF398A0